MNLKPYLLALPALLLAACGGGGGGDDPEFADAAVVATRAPDYSSGAVSLVQAQAPFTAQNNLTPRGSDISVRSGGDHYFVIEKFRANRISRYEAGSTTPTYTYSTQSAGEVESNPYDIVIASATKAYLLRYGSSKIWIVNPSAATEAAFKTGEIDLAAYDGDGVPEITDGVIKDGKLFVLMQRLESYAATQAGYVAVIDTATDLEITTTTRASGLKGIELPLRNPSKLVSVPGEDEILVVAPGDYGSYPTYIPAYDGGIAEIESDDYDVRLLVDDGDATTHPYGQIVDVAVIDDDRAYFIGSTGYGADQTLYRFNPDLATPVPVAVEGYASLALGSLAVDPNGQLWVSRTDNEAPGLSVLGYAGGRETVVKDFIDTDLTPINVDFVTVPLS
ncbi:hypothetical protein [Hydrocarboniphaga effusa]|jgi:hypothetical protein|uniref:hypothetical protein n=1 Tax=Hydrocarboniphaga effusa TaxID=243629 RepID=UPI00398C0627